nr:uncharacterized protein CTRU02_08714 [Colletotrichum truncatum]KAF6789467.1 hypothetical protein CTRU02_08714 [Colletotrichum truncatum]
MERGNQIIPKAAQTKLSNIQIAVLKKGGIIPEEMKKLSYTNVQESSTQPTLVAAMTGDKNDDLTVSASSTDSGKTIFDDISKTKLGKNAYWVDKDYIKKGILANRVHGSRTTPCLDVLFP